jgi:hypothetical protein
LVAKFISPTLAAGIYHEYSGFVFFPIALLAMLLFSRLINLNWSQRKVPHDLQREAVTHDY